MEMDSVRAIITGLAIDDAKSCGNSIEILESGTRNSWSKLRTKRDGDINDFNGHNHQRVRKR